MEENKELIIKKVVHAAYEVGKHLKAGYLESVYQNAMLIELRKIGLAAQAEVPISVYYKEQLVGEFRADIIVDGWLIVELKATSSISVAHEVQLVNYLEATKNETGLLINFGESRVRVIRRWRKDQE